MLLSLGCWLLKKKCLFHIISSFDCTLKSILAIPPWQRQIPILRNNSLNFIKKPLFKSDSFHVEADMEMAFLEQSWFALLGVIAHDSLLCSPLVWIFHNPDSRCPPLREAVVHMTGRTNFNEDSLLLYWSCSLSTCLSGRLLDASCNHCSLLTMEKSITAACPFDSGVFNIWHTAARVMYRTNPLRTPFPASLKGAAIAPLSQPTLSPPVKQPQTLLAHESINASTANSLRQRPPFHYIAHPSCAQQSPDLWQGFAAPAETKMINKSSAPGPLKWREVCALSFDYFLTTTMNKNSTGK